MGWGVFPHLSTKESPCLWFALVHHQLESVTLHNTHGLLLHKLEVEIECPTPFCKTGGCSFDKNLTLYRKKEPKRLVPCTNNHSFIAVCVDR